ncbi:MAG TPA: NAD(P)H-hydrate epimerase [Anaerolineales bacterium]|nr:NAD(P)H-hydrate epimerase [Anaerolineales bacterium]
MNIPAITTQQMIQVDRLMIETYGIQLIQMMENAGKSLAELSRNLLGDDVQDKNIAVICGAGNNGGGGMVAARHLHNWGASILLKITAPHDSLKEIPAHQYQILKAMGINDHDEVDLTKVDFILDAMIGYGLKSDPKGSIADWIRNINQASVPVLSLDAPSGFDTSTGTPRNPCLRANATMTLALPKSGLRSPGSQAYIGDLYLADISVPPQLYANLGLEIPELFRYNSIIKLQEGS